MIDTNTPRFLVMIEKMRNHLEDIDEQMGEEFTPVDMELVTDATALLNEFNVKSTRRAVEKPVLFDLVDKTLTSSGLIHTPGIIQYAVTGYKTGDADQMINLLVEGYKMDREEAIQVLEGRVELHFDHAAGTVSYQLKVPRKS